MELHREAEDRAIEIRNRLECGLRPIPDIVEALETLGLTVFVVPWGTDGPLGAFLPRGDRNFVFLNSEQPLPRLTFSGAHELGHFVFTDGPKLDGVAELGTANREIGERRANSFAASLLLPRNALKLAVGDGRKVSAEDVVHIATEFGVSYQMATYRLHNTGFINAARRDKLIGERAAVLTPEFRRRISAMWQFPAEYVENALDAYLASRVHFDRLVELLRLDSNDRVGLARDLFERGQLHEDDEQEFSFTAQA